jgi:hypothetical protein
MAEGKIVSVGHRNQHARRARYPEGTKARQRDDRTTDYGTTGKGRREVRAGETLAQTRETRVLPGAQPMRSRFARSLNLDLLSRAHEQIILETRPETLCFTAFLKIGRGESSRFEAFTVDDHQLLPFLCIQ